MVVYGVTLFEAHAKLGEEWLKSVAGCFSQEKSYPLSLRPFKYNYCSQAGLDILSSVADTRRLCWINFRIHQTAKCQPRAKQRAIAAMMALPRQLQRVCVTNRAQREEQTDMYNR